VLALALALPPLRGGASNTLASAIQTTCPKGRAREHALLQTRLYRVSQPYALE
jgi:hypothetical protein